MTSRSEIDLGVVTKFFIFQVMTVFFGSFIAGSLANQLKTFISTPSSILTVLGTAAPQTAIFFMTFLLLQGLLSKPLSLLRLADLVKFWLKSRLAATQRARARLWQDQTLEWGTVVPDDTIAALLGLVFCTICPLITPIAFVYFAITLTVYKYQLLYVYRQEYQSGGKVWTRVFTQLCFGLLMHQLIMLAILGIKQTVLPPLMVLPLPFITVFYCEHDFLAAIQEADIMLAWLAGGQQDKQSQDIEASPTLEEDYQSADEGEGPAGQVATCITNQAFSADDPSLPLGASGGGEAELEAVDVQPRPLGE
ncbi:hypothetical protein N2152v2_005340 [Parachlorella kessleri]